jgi:hypothetical protein
MSLSPGAIFELSRIALRTTQVGLGAMFGVSRRTAQRWSDRGFPSTQLPKLASLVHPLDPKLAAAIAAAAGTTLEALGIVRPEPAPPPPLLPPPAPPLPDSVVDAVVCAAAEAMDTMPRHARAGVHAAFARAKELGVDVAFVERVLRAQLPPPAPGTPDEPATTATPRKPPRT